MWKKLLEWLKSLFNPKQAPAVEQAPVFVEEKKGAYMPDLSVIYISEMPDFGEKGEHVSALINRLNHFGASPALKDDKTFGPKVKAATSEFQKKNGLPGSGVLGPKTLELLKLEIKPEALPPKPDVPVGAWVVPSYVVKSPRSGLEKKLENLVDAHLLKHHFEAFRAACEAKNGNKVHALFNMAIGEMDIRERTGKNDGEMVELLQETIGRAEREPYCMSTQQSGIGYAERKTDIVSKIIGSESVMTTYDSSPSSCKVSYKDSQEGDIWCWRRGTSWQGHCGCFLFWMISLTKARLVEGNTTFGVDDKGKIEREGGGVYFTDRAPGKIGELTLVGVLRPF